MDGDSYPSDLPVLPGTTVSLQPEQTMWIVTAPDLAARTERLREAATAWQDDPRVTPLLDLMRVGEESTSSSHELAAHVKRGLESLDVADREALMAAISPAFGSSDVGQRELETALEFFRARGWHAEATETGEGAFASTRWRLTRDTETRELHLSRTFGVAVLSLRG